MRKTVKIILVLVVISLVYAVLRYNVHKGVPWIHLPLYIFNKSIALTALFILSLAYILGSLKGIGLNVSKGLLSLRKYFGVLGFFIALMHIFITFSVFRKEQYGKFFSEDGTLALLGELSLLFGVLGLFTFLVPAIFCFPSVREKFNEHEVKLSQQLGYLGVVFIFFHVFFMGYKGWFDVSHWPGGFPPISLIAGLAALIVLIAKLISVVFSRQNQY